MKSVKLDPQLLSRDQPIQAGLDNLNATLKAHGLYNTFQFVLRLSPAVHHKIGELPKGIVSSRELGFDGVQAFSTYLHETIHWWQHVGSTHGLMRSLSYPTQAHANYAQLKELVDKIGFKKPIRRLAMDLPGPTGYGTLSGLANTVVNNHFDFDAFRSLTYDQTSAKEAAANPLFECVAHAYHVTYANNILVLAATVDPEFRIFQRPKEWAAHFRALEESKEQGFYYGSPIALWPVSAREILEGQACFGQLQYLTFASGGKLGWDDFRAIGMLHGVYAKAFASFLDAAGLEWPPTVDHPTVGLFLLICDMAINPGEGFPHLLRDHFREFITDIDPGARFAMLSTIVRLKCQSAVGAIQKYSRAEYEQVTEELATALRIDSPLAIAATCCGWAQERGPLVALMKEYQTFDYMPINLPVRVLFSHFIAFMQDKFFKPEFFCWPGASMVGKSLSEQESKLFDRHAALFLDKEDDDGIFPRRHADRDEQRVHDMFENFYASNITYDMTNQWIAQPGPFTYDYRWLSQSGSRKQIRDFAARHFIQVYGVHPDEAEFL
jgi:hypothetical protein